MFFTCEKFDRWRTKECFQRDFMWPPCSHVYVNGGLCRYTYQSGFPVEPYFDTRSANSFNVKVKAFRAQFRGVSDMPFFIFRLAKIFA